MSPLYPHRCRACGHTFEILCSTHGEYVAHANPCPACGSCDCERVVTAPAIRFRGDGWDTQGAREE